MRARSGIDESGGGEDTSCGVEAFGRTFEPRRGPRHMSGTRRGGQGAMLSSMRMQTRDS